MSDFNKDACRILADVESCCTITERERVIRMALQAVREQTMEDATDALGVVKRNYLYDDRPESPEAEMAVDRCLDAISALKRREETEKGEGDSNG